ncbi:MAG: hypothetical protein JO170_18300 [Verrucomicrobia bacterium]|nr:hypothetical protein [Verrucomicrobiota bacterium]
MRVVVEDANVSLDLVSGGILALWFGAGFEKCTTHLVWQELTVAAQRQYVQPFIEAGLSAVGGYSLELVGRDIEALGR